LPSLALQAERRAALPDEDDLEAALDEASLGLPFNAGLFDDFRKGVEASRTLQPLDAGAGLDLFAKTPLGARLEQLLLQAEDQWYGFVPVSGVAEMAGLEDLAARVEGVELIDLKLFSEDILNVFRDEAYLLFAQGTAIVLLLLAAFRYPPSVIARIFLVLAVSITVTIGMLVLFGEKLTMLHILAALLVIGLGLDYTIFFSWPDADEHQSIRTRHALLVCVLSTVLVFGLLALSSIDLLRAIGLTVALGACTTFAVAYAILSRHHE
jgi:predicted exporter